MTDRPERILVVEDEGLVAYAVEQVLLAFGYDVVGPVPNTRKALELIAGEVIDAAVLDVNLGDERIDVVAETLAAEGIPFVFATGYSGISALPPAFQDRPTLNKPYHAGDLHKALTQVMAESAADKTRASGAIRAQ